MPTWPKFTSDDVVKASLDMNGWFSARMCWLSIPQERHQEVRRGIKGLGEQHGLKGILSVRRHLRALVASGDLERRVCIGTEYFRWIN